MPPREPDGAARRHLHFRILAAAGAIILLLVTFLIPVSAILLGVLVLDEALLLRQVAGMAMIGAGLAAIDGRLPRLVGRWLHRALHIAGASRTSKNSPP